MLDFDIACGETIMLYKKGDANQLKNYRPITLLNTNFRFLTSVVNHKIQKMLQKTILATQFPKI